MDRGAWQAVVQGVAKSQTQFSETTAKGGKKGQIVMPLIAQWQRIHLPVQETWV